MSRRDYDHWNEDADWVWWQEEGRFATEEEDYDPDIDDDGRDVRWLPDD